MVSNLSSSGEFSTRCRTIMHSHFMKSLYWFALIASAGFLLASPIAFSQGVSTFSCSDCASMPKPLNIPKPVYPKKVRDAKISGTVTVRITIGEKGKVIEAKVDSGDEMLRASAVAAAMKATFDPAMSVGHLDDRLRFMGF